MEKNYSNNCDIVQIQVSLILFQLEYIGSIKSSNYGSSIFLGLPKLAVSHSPDLLEELW